MPTLLWRVLSYVGYPDGMEPRYFWSNEQLGEGLLVTMEAVVHPLGDGSEWTGWRFKSTGRTTKEAAERAAFGILRDIMDRFPQELTAAIVGVFPRGNPSTDSWQQARGRSLEISTAEAQNGDNPAMSAMFAVMKAFDGVEGSLRCVSGALGQAHDDRRQLQRDHDAEIERLTAEMAQLTCQRDQATQRIVVFEGDVCALREQVGRLTTANRNAERMLTHVLLQRNEAWSAENVLRARQFELEQQLANAEDYNDNLHEEVHWLNNQLNPYVPLGAAELDLDEDEDLEEPEAPAEEDDDAVNGDDANVSDLDSDHDE
jgi:hypothetical protein